MLNFGLKIVGSVGVLKTSAGVILQLRVYISVSGFGPGPSFKVRLFTNCDAAAHLWVSLFDFAKHRCFVSGA